MSVSAKVLHLQISQLPEIAAITSDKILAIARNKGKITGINVICCIWLLEQPRGFWSTTTEEFLQQAPF